ncbi:MAG: 30S ribosomal protein S3 [Spirochaetes bacterium]|nr:30S ribosomal protein S3 [Spirochaetota bacterium]
MGQKVNPIGLRIGVNKKWSSIWFAKKEYADNLIEDLNIRKYIRSVLGKSKDAAISKITIERFTDKININIHTARPAIVIGRKGQEIEGLKKKIIKLISNKNVQIKIVQIKKPELDAKLISENIAAQIEKRTPYRRAMKQAMSNAMRSGAKGIKIHCSGRLGGSEMARQESYKEGRIPLQTLRAQIDYGITTAVTTLGSIGVKVWVYTGDLYDKFEI